MHDQMIGNYKIIEKIGSGGMGDVFRGFDVMLEREVAIKSLRPELNQREDLIARFRTEAVAMGRLNHPNIATIYNFMYQDVQYFLVMEFVPGQPLNKIIEQSGSISVTEALPLLCNILKGLEHAHQFGIVHRDIKPANVMITPSGLKLMDFGIARILQQARQTQAGHMVGTLEYMSPEHLQGLETDARTDIYSVGIIAYELLTGHLPFRKDTDYAIIKAQIEEKPSPLRSLSPDIPESVEKIILKALHKHADKRYQSATEFIEALESCIAPVVTPTISSKQPPYWIILAGVAVLSIVIVFFFVLWSPTVVVDYPTASIEQLVKLAKKNDPKAQNEMGSRYSKGQGIPPNPGKAIEWYQKAADNGLAEAQLRLGTIYSTGQGAEQNLEQAKFWLDKAEQAGEPGAAFQLGFWCYKKEAYDQALEWFDKSYKQGEKKASKFIGTIYSQKNDYPNAVPWLEKAVDIGDSDAMYLLGTIAYNGLNGVVDLIKAKELLEKAAEQNHAEAQYVLGRMYRYGKGTIVNLEIARKWFQRSKENGNKLADKELNNLM
jgi:serine/threonine protein kinase